MSAARAFSIVETTQAGAARRGAMAFAREIGFDDVDVGKVGIVVTEAATNMMKHAHGGRVLVQAMEDGERRGMGLRAMLHRAVVVWFAYVFLRVAGAAGRY